MQVLVLEYVAMAILVNLLLEQLFIFLSLKMIE